MQARFLLVVATALLLAVSASATQTAWAWVRADGTVAQTGFDFPLNVTRIGRGHYSR